MIIGAVYQSLNSERQVIRANRSDRPKTARYPRDEELSRQEISSLTSRSAATTGN
jgi:hypothetical protein